MRNTSELIRHKRNGGFLHPKEIRSFLAGVVDGSIPRYQAAAMLMAIYFRGMGEQELADFTAAMIDSGDRLDIPSPMPKVDKHSTGGVGDKVSICLAPLVAACGVAVPMMSGRGLGHTGGTLDKLESIPGFRTSLSPAEFAEVVETCGVVIAGQSERIVPADKILYALRDTTATVASIPLISSSIMSKKLAEGLDALILDIKVGAGAFMETTDRARELAGSMVRIGELHGTRVRAYLTRMDQPLGFEVGNANEIKEAISVLAGTGPPDLLELVKQLGVGMLDEAAIDDPASRIEEAIESGSGLEKLEEMIRAQGGDPTVVEHPDLLPPAGQARTVAARQAGYVVSIDAMGIGLAAMSLGAGRQTVDDHIDHAAGISLAVKVGDRVSPGDELATLHFNDNRMIGAASAKTQEAFRISDEPPPPRPLIVDEV